MSSRDILRHPAFAYFWGATTLRAFGGAIAGVAFQVLIVTVVNATPMQISILSALGVVPYLFLGLIVGALMDRWRRQRTLVLTTIGRAVTLAAIPVLLLLDALDFWSLAVVILVLGVLTLFADSAAQPLLPRIVPRGSLVTANARLGQSQTVAETAGPALGGVLFTLLGRRSSSLSRSSSTRSPPSCSRASRSTSRSRRRAPRAGMWGTTSPRACGSRTGIRPCGLSRSRCMSGSSATASS